jgi:hypothetical protein
MFRRQADLITPTEQTEARIHEARTSCNFDPRRWSQQTASKPITQRRSVTDNISCIIQPTRLAAVRKLISFTCDVTNDVFACINRRQLHHILSHRTRSLALALFKHKLNEDIISHYFHTIHQLNKTALYRLSSFETLLGLLWIAMFCFQCVKWLWWFLSLSKAYYPHQQKQRGCSRVFLIWPMNSLLIPSFGCH